MAYPQVQPPAPRQNPTHAATLWLLSQPTRDRAEQVIRVTRDLAYFEKWDHFTAGVGDALGVSPALTPFLGATMGAGLDLLFDRGVDMGPKAASGPPNLCFLGHRVRRWGDPKRALAWHLSDRAPKAATPGQESLDDAVATTLVLTTLGGVAGDHGGCWLPLWQEWLERTVIAQVASCGLKGSTRPTRRIDGASTLAPYLELAGATDMAALSIAGLVGFTPQHAALIDPLRAILPALSKLVRLAADMAFDETEPANCAVYLAAAERGISLREARCALMESKEHTISVEKKLIELTRRDLDRFLAATARSKPAIASLARVVEQAVLAEIALVRESH